jgi:hypothetical protein
MPRSKQRDARSNNRDVAEKPDDVCCAPESGQPPGGPEDPWAGEDEVTPAHVWPVPHHASPKDEL